VKVSAALPTGVAALLFESARARRRLEGRLAALVEGHGYAEAILPILDYLEPYESLLTPASRGELYRFIDRDGEQLALRADFTPMLARLLAPRFRSATASSIFSRRSKSTGRRLSGSTSDRSQNSVP